jgi:hypothetical protein
MFLLWIPPRSDTQQPSAPQWTNNGKISYVAVCVVSRLLFLFAAFRVFSVPFTHDQSFTSLNFVESHSFREFIFLPTYASANHPLNTILMKIVTLVEYLLPGR